MLFQSETITIEKDTDGSAFLRIDVPGRSVNVLTSQVLRDFGEALTRLEREKNLPLLVIRSGKKTGFLAGADVREFLDIADAETARQISQRGQDLFARLARLPFPTIASISGPCLGGGLELALACDYRLAFQHVTTQLGLPEVELGLLPAWGGTQRLPRVCGLENALNLILTGKRIGAAEAYRLGIIDVLARSENELRTLFPALQKRAITQGKRQIARPERRTWRQWFLETTTVGKRVLLRASERVLQRKVPDDMQAPHEAFAAIVVGALEGLEAGYQREREAAGHLATSVPCRRLIGLFLAREAARKLPAELAQADNQSVQRVGIVGASPLGAGLAQLAALRGAEVIVQETDAEALGAGIVRIQQLFQKAIERGLIPQAEALSRLAAIKGVVDWKGFDSVQVVVETRPDSLEARERLFREMEGRLRADCVLASCTAAHSLSSLMEGLSRPERVAGLQVSMPVHRVPLIEVVHTDRTNLASRARLMNWVIALGKTPVAVRDSAGRVVHRVLIPYLGEAIQLVREGMGIATIDEEMRRFGMTTGPLELLDSMGLDTIRDARQALQPLLGERLPADDALEAMLGSGWNGQESGKGFYLHEGKKSRVNRLAENLLRRGQPQGALRNLSLDARRADARERLVLRSINEAVYCVTEGLTTTAEEIDLALVLGSGWAPHRGGPLHFIDDVGVQPLVHRMQNLAQRLGSRFLPCDELIQRAESGQRFTRA